jgi:hypothetical protein
MRGWIVICEGRVGRGKLWDCIVRLPSEMMVVVVVMMQMACVLLKVVRVVMEMVMVLMLVRVRPRTTDCFRYVRGPLAVMAVLVVVMLVVRLWCGDVWLSWFGLLG